MKRYYISHPYTGNEEHNKADAERIRSTLKVANPEICFMNPLGMFGGKETDYCTALSDALELLSCCDAIVLCPGWEKSTGCRAEKAFAMQQGIAIKYFNEADFAQKKATKNNCDNTAKENPAGKIVKTGMTNEEFAKAINLLRSRSVVLVIVLYKHPADFSSSYVARVHRVNFANKSGSWPSREAFIVRDTLAEVRAAIPASMCMVDRSPDDDPCILGTYI